MDIDKKRFRKMFPQLGRELEASDCGMKMNSTRSDLQTGERACSKKFSDYVPDIIDFLRRCDNEKQAEEIIRYMEARGEIRPSYAKRLWRQLRDKGLRSFGTKKEDDYYLKQDGF